MPIIKDKYGKGSLERSKFLTRDINKAKTTPTPTGINALQKRELEKISYRTTAANKNETVIGRTAENTSQIKGFNFTAANTVYQILALSPGDKIKNIVINNNSGSASPVISLYWSVSSQEEGSFTVSSGVITAHKGLTLYSLFSESFTTYSTASLGDAVNHIFEGLNKTIYLYAVSSTTDPSITIGYSSE